MEELRMGVMLQNARKEKRWKQMDLARELQKLKLKPEYDLQGYRSWIANLESGRAKKLFPHELKAFAKALGRPENYFSVIGSTEVTHDPEGHTVTMRFSECQGVSIVNDKVSLDPLEGGYEGKTTIVGVIIKKR